ncbi:MAG: cupredoxin domain-containing protein [Rhodospirillales bacterium]|nr:cupredoxin domain-containing protein [Alphaproteobacteria bacterium]MCB1841145.1 cupredoxin domain-containing protein [Alphaproteobacteria bacterium]MCB9977662.1 cupredoxin domain-containing protein [Rhodospirillales bacterium]
MKSLNRLAFLASLAVFPLFSSPAFAEGDITIVLKDHKFEPSTVEVPAGERVKLIIDNQDPTPEEFESHELKREKVIKGNGQGVVMIGPLEEGSYAFVGEFNEETAKGVIVAKSPSAEDVLPDESDISPSAGESQSSKEEMPEDLKRALGTSDSTVPVPLQPLPNPKKVK